MMSAAYPRDLVGYGRNPPLVRFPGDARIAVQFVINYEEGGENSILHGDGASEAFLSEIVGAEPWPGQRHMNMESIYEYGSRAGFWRLWRLFTQRRMPATVFAVASAMERNPEAVAGMKDANWEIASHGLRWIDYRNFSDADERTHILEAIRRHTEVTGARPLGFYQGRTSENTLALILAEQGFLYSADSYADDLPYWIEGPHGPHLIVPYTLDANDMRYATAQGFNSGDQFFTYLKDSFDVLYAEGATSPKLLSVGLHCRISGRPDAPPRSRGSSTMCKVMIGFGSRRACRSLGIGSLLNRRRRDIDRQECRGRSLLNGSATSSSIHLGLPSKRIARD